MPVGDLGHGDQVLGPIAQFELGTEPGDDERPVPVVEPGGRRVGERDVAEIGQRRAAPLGQRHQRVLPGGAVIAPAGRSVHPLGRRIGPDQVGRDHGGAVSGRDPLNQVRVRSERPAQARHHDAQPFGRPRPVADAPQVDDELLGRHGRAAGKGQSRQQGAFERPRHHHAAAERRVSQQPDLHSGHHAR